MIKLRLSDRFLALSLLTVLVAVAFDLTIPRPGPVKLEAPAPRFTQERINMGKLSTYFLLHDTQTGYDFLVTTSGGICQIQ